MNGTQPPTAGNGKFFSGSAAGTRGFGFGTARAPAAPAVPTTPMERACTLALPVAVKSPLEMNPHWAPRTEAPLIVIALGLGPRAYKQFCELPSWATARAESVNEFTPKMRMK